MQKKIQALTEEIKQYQGDPTSFQLRYTSRKGAIAELFKKISELSPQKVQSVGQQLNALKKQAHEKLQQLQEAEHAKTQASERIDPTLPPVYPSTGSLHPLRIIENKVVDIFEKIGFQKAEAREIEHDFYNFSALNFPKDHPARDMQDTFFLDKKKEWLLRTHTSNAQSRIMSKGQPPFRIVTPGRVFRRETISARTHCMFHQIEAFYVAENVSVADLKGILQHLIQHLFGPTQTMRLRPSFFPFTAPSVEVDISCFFCAQKGCTLCKKAGWIEILGAGIIDPNVLKACKINPEKYSGYALGMGIERLAMLHYQIEDLRLFTQNDIRFLQQFAPLH